jgi:hypothetical protein
MPTKREREYYRMGVRDGLAIQSDPYGERGLSPLGDVSGMTTREFTDIGLKRRKPKRKLSAWNKFVKANSKKKEFRYANGKLKLKKMGIAFRKKRRR